MPSKASICHHWEVGKFAFSNLLMCIFDVGSDLYATVSFFRSKQYNLNIIKGNSIMLMMACSYRDIYYGSLTLLLVLLPFLYSFLKDLIKMALGKKRCQLNNFNSVYHLPILQLIKYFDFLKKVNNKGQEKKELKEFEMEILETFELYYQESNEQINKMDWFHFVNILEFQHEKEDKIRRLRAYLKEVVRLSNRANEHQNTIKRAMKKHEEKLDNEMAQIQTEIQEFKLLEIICESIPQFILQLSILIHEDPYFETDESTSLKKIIVLLSSCGSVVLVLTSTLLNMPHYYETSQSMKWKKIAPYLCWKNLILVLPVMCLIVAPRLILLGIGFALCKGPSALLLLIAFMFYFLLFFFIAIIGNYKKGTIEHMIYAFITSIIGPAVTIDPSTNILVGSNLSAMFSHIIFAILVASTTLIAPKWMSIDENVLPTYRNILLILVIAVALTSCLGFLLTEENRQLIALRMPWPKCPVCCVIDEQLVWAMMRKSNRLIDFYSRLKDGHSIKFDPDSKKHYSSEDLKAIFENALQDSNYGKVVYNAFLLQGFSNDLVNRIRNKTTGTIEVKSLNY